MIKLFFKIGFIITVAFGFVAFFYVLTIGACTYLFVAPVAEAANEAKKEFNKHVDDINKNIKKADKAITSELYKLKQNSQSGAAK